LGPTKGKGAKRAFEFSTTRRNLPVGSTVRPKESRAEKKRR